jgi:hypothetical protein
VKPKTLDWKADFPMREEVEHFSGERRSFVIDCHEGGLGYTVRASEEGKDGMGYEFAAHSETSPYSALARVREKMSRRLATQHITASQHGPRMLHDTVAGRITSGGEGQVALIVDGITLRIERTAHRRAARDSSATQWLSSAC